MRLKGQCNLKEWLMQHNLLIRNAYGSCRPSARPRGWKFGTDRAIFRDLRFGGLEKQTHLSDGRADGIQWDRWLDFLGFVFDWRLKKRTHLSGQVDDWGWVGQIARFLGFVFGRRLKKTDPSVGTGGRLGSGGTERAIFRDLRSAGG